MRVLVNGVRLYFDVEGAALVPDGPAMRQKPTVLLLHGGPGFDHTSYKPAYSALTDIAQLVYLDHRGNGRSEDGPQELWTLSQWGDDVIAFGGFVAMSYATRHPEHPAKLILISTEAKGQSYLEQRVALFESLGGPEVGALARRRFLETGGHKDQASVEAWQRLALPLYTRKGHDPDMMARALRRPAVLQWFTRPGGEVTSFDLVPDLHRISCPTLVMGGEDDPMTPIACQVDIAAALRPDLVRFERFADCGHGVVSDQPERAFAVIRDFILGTHG